MAGGFIPEADSSASNAARIPAPTRKACQPLLALTPKQETRLCAHLDDRLLGLERDERKQAFGSIPLLLDRLFPLLHLTLQIPARTPWADLRVSYLLNLTGFLATYVTSMPLLTSGAMRRKGKEAEYEAGRVMRDVLGFLAEVERGWMAVLGGQGWVMDENEEEGVKEEEGEEGEVRRRLGHGVPVDFAGSVGQTERTRLRSIIISSRAKFTAWARTYGSFAGSSLEDTAQAARGERRTMGCEGPADFDPDPPTSYPALAPASRAGDSVESAGVGGGAWEDRILGMWNTILESLTDQDLGAGRGR